MCGNLFRRDDIGNVLIRNPVFRRGKHVICMDRLTDRNTARMTVMNPRTDIHCQIGCIWEPCQRGTLSCFFSGMFRRCGDTAASGFDMFGISLMRRIETLLMPGRDIGNRAPCRNRRPEIRTTSRHQQGAVPAAGTSDKIHACRIDVSDLLHIGDGIFQIGNDKFGTASILKPVGTAEIRKDKIPVILNAEITVIPGSLCVISAPSVKCDEKCRSNN